MRPRIVHPNNDICDLLCLPKLRLKFDGHLLHEVLLEQLLYRQQIDLLLRLLLRGLAIPLEHEAMPVDRMQDPIELGVLSQLVLIVQMISAGIVHD